MHRTCKYGIMEITQVWKYTTTHRRAVSLPGDREEDRERERSIGDQLNNIISHIEVKDICKNTNFQIQNCTKYTNFQYKRKDQLNNIISHIEVNTMIPKYANSQLQLQLDNLPFLGS